MLHYIYGYSLPDIRGMLLTVKIDLDKDRIGREIVKGLCEIAIPHLQEVVKEWGVRDVPVPKALRRGRPRKTPE